MGLFGGLFDKKECSICGGEIGMLGNRKLEDGNCCKECVKKLSPWFEERRHSTVEDIKKQLAYREANKANVQAFQVTREFAADSYHVFIDDTKGQFAITTGNSMNAEINPDIVNLSQVKSCKLQIDQTRKEEQYRNNEGQMVDYNPPRYTYSYNYSIKLGVNSPWFDDMDFRLNTFDVKEHDRMKMMDMENLGNQIVAALTGRPVQQPMNNGMQGNMYGQPMNNGMQGNMYGQPMSNGMQGNMYGQPMNSGMQGNMYGQPMNNGMQGNMYGQPMNNGMQGNMYGQPMNNGMQGNMYGQPMNNGMPNQAQTWQCGCGAVNTAKFCQNCGQPNPMAAVPNQGYGNRMIRCDKCGWVAEDMNNIPKFCPACGDPINANDIQ